MAAWLQEKIIVWSATKCLSLYITSEVQSINPCSWMYRCDQWPASVSNVFQSLHQLFVALIVWSCACIYNRVQGKHARTDDCHIVQGVRSHICARRIIAGLVARIPMIHDCNLYVWFKLQADDTHELWSFCGHTHHQSISQSIIAFGP